MKRERDREEYEKDVEKAERKRQKKNVAKTKSRGAVEIETKLQATNKDLEISDKKRKVKTENRKGDNSSYVENLKIEDRPESDDDASSQTGQSRDSNIGEDVKLETIEKEESVYKTDKKEKPKRKATERSSKRKKKVMEESDVKTDTKKVLTDATISGKGSRRKHEKNSLTSLEPHSNKDLVDQVHGDNKVEDVSVIQKIPKKVERTRAKPKRGNKREKDVSPSTPISGEKSLSREMKKSPRKKPKPPKKIKELKDGDPEGKATVDTKNNKRKSKVGKMKSVSETALQTRPRRVRKRKVVDTSPVQSSSSNEEEGRVASKEKIRNNTRGKVKLNAVQRGTGPGANKFVGAHTSISGGLENAVSEAVMLGARAFGMFLRSSRTWKFKPLTDEAAEKFKQAMQECGFSPDMVVPHGSYLMNCGSSKEDTLSKSRETLIDELMRCEKLGLNIFNFHPGSTCGEISVEKCLDTIAESINIAHSKTKYCISVIENMSCQGSTIGGKFTELKGIIDRVKDKSRMGVCLDTCHAFAAGYDLSTKDGYEKMMTDFENIIGLEYLKAVHVNDSKGDVGCHKDRHEDIGKGKIGLDGFRRIMNDPRFDNIPFVLETPGGYYDKEIKTLYSLCKT